jgi:aspartyl-tRNA(Asn)/glutamyl-tRNA(Gln) amidotransferase subunit C
MSDQITIDIFNHLVQLAALDLTPDQAEYLRRELNNQLKAINELAAIPLDENIPINLHGVAYPPEISQPPRQDEWIAYADPAGIIEQAPESEDGYIIVPDIPHTTLE